MVGSASPSDAVRSALDLSVAEDSSQQILHMLLCVYTLLSVDYPVPSLLFYDGLERRQWLGYGDSRISLCLHETGRR